MMLERGVVVSQETIRRRYRSHGSLLTARLRRNAASASNVRHLDEIVQTRRNTKAEKRLLVRLLKKQGCAPKRIVTDKLRSYGAARRQVIPQIDNRLHKGLNNRAENSHLPFRKRERTRQGFRSIGALQSFVLIFSATRNHFVQATSDSSAGLIKAHRINVIAEWNATAHKLE